VWKSGQKKKITFDDIVKILLSVSKDTNHKIIVGSDSVKLGSDWIFTKAIAIINPSSGFYDRKYFYLREVLKDESYIDLSKRLLKETTDSLKIAMHIRDTISAANIEIHADVNSDHIHNSSKYKNMISGYISGCGFEVKVKPESFVASSIADNHTRKN
jgi:hypothetical protein